MKATPMTFLQTRTETAAPLATPLHALPALLRAAAARLLQRRPPKSPEDLLAAQTRRAEARAAVDRLMQHSH